MIDEAWQSIQIGSSMIAQLPEPASFESLSGYLNYSFVSINTQYKTNNIFNNMIFSINIKWIQIASNKIYLHFHEI